MAKTLEERFWPKVLKSDGCWLWTASLDSKGYGQIQIGTLASPKTARAHRIAYELTYGEIPEGLVVDHLCRTTRCVNPAHLEAVSFHENLLRGKGGRLRTHCIKGHAFDSENTAIYEGKRRCRECHRVWARDYRRKASVI